MNIWEIKNNLKCLDFLIRANNTREFFDEWIDTRNFLSFVDIDYSKLIEKIQDGKIAIFPIDKRQYTTNIVNHIKYGFTVYLLQSEEFDEFKKNYIEDCVNSSKVMTEEI